MHSSEKMFLTFFNVGLSGPPKMSDFIMYSVQVWACTLYMRWIFLRSAFDRGWRIWWFKLIKNFTKKIYFLTGQNCLRKKKSWKKYFFVSCLDLPYALCQCSCPLPPHTTACPPASLCNHMPHLPAGARNRARNSSQKWEISPKCFRKKIFKSSAGPCWVCWRVLGTLDV